MKNNDDFKKLLELKRKYKGSPTKAQKEEVQQEVARLIAGGYATPTLRIVYDLGIEKYRTIGLEDMAVKTYEKDKSIRGIMRKTYGSEFLPNNATDLIPFKELVFNPFKPLNYSRNGMDYANLFIPSRFFSFKQTKENMIDAIQWEKHPNIKALFENVFKSISRMNYFCNWLSYGFQIRKKSGTAIISKGIQGTGKGVIFEEIIKHAIGERYVTILDNEALKSRFNGELENKLFILANEIKADFREGNTIYERLKMYITDPNIRCEEKNVKARSVPNFFNVWFHSNNDIPLQIQGSDRRYTVFNTKSKKLIEVSEDLGYKHLRFFIDEIRKERDNFIIDLMRLKYDVLLATTPLQTDEKDLIYEASMSKLEVMSDKIKNYDIKYFKDAISDFYESTELAEVKQEIFKTMNINNADIFIAEVQSQFDGNYIKNDLSKILYRILINEDEKDRKIGLQLNKHFGKAILKNLNGKRFKHRIINNDKNVSFEKCLKSIPIEYEALDGSKRTEDYIIEPYQEDIF